MNFSKFKVGVVHFTKLGSVFRENVYLCQRLYTGPKGRLQRKAWKCFKPYLPYFLTENSFVLKLHCRCTLIYLYLILHSSGDLLEICLTHWENVHTLLNRVRLHVLLRLHVMLSWLLKCPNCYVVHTCTPLLYYMGLNWCWCLELVYVWMTDSKSRPLFTLNIDVLIWIFSTICNLVPFLILNQCFGT